MHTAVHRVYARHLAAPHGWRCGYTAPLVTISREKSVKTPQKRQELSAPECSNWVRVSVVGVPWSTLKELLCSQNLCGSGGCTQIHVGHRHKIGTPFAGRRGRKGLGGCVHLGRRCLHQFQRLFFPALFLLCVWVGVVVSGWGSHRC